MYFGLGNFNHVKVIEIPLSVQLLKQNFSVLYFFLFKHLLSYYIINGQNLRTLYLKVNKKT